MPSFTQFVKNQHTVLPIVPRPQDCEGATYIVTGANTGLGFECSKHLVRLSAKRVILGVRTLRKGEEAKAKIEDETGRKGVLEVWHLDLTSHDSVKKFAVKVRELDRIDAIIENAGVALDKYTIAEGLETTLTVNDVNTMFLAALVLPKLQENAERFNNTPHLAVVGSSVAFEAKGVLEKADGDILEELSKGIDRKRYQTSKLILLYAVRELASMRPTSETGVTINFISPGLCVTELTRHVGPIPQLIIGTMRRLLGRTAEEGSRTLLHAAVAGKESHGKYLSECEIKDYQVASWITDDAGRKMQKRVWESLSKRLNAIQPGCI